MVGKANRFRVAYVDQGYECAFLVHTLEDAMFWARHLRRRWSIGPWIEREHAPASRGI